MITTRHPLPRTAKKRASANAHYVENVGLIRKHLADIAHVVERDNAADGDRDWGQVGTMADVEQKLRQIADMLLNRGEYAPGNAHPDEWERA